MLPALLFFTCMIAFLPGIAGETLPSDFILQQLRIPAFHFLFQAMIFAALLESGTGAVHAINERIATAWRLKRGSELSYRARAACAAVLLIGCIFMAGRFGLVALIGSGYRILAYTILLIFVAPVMTIGVARLVYRKQSKLELELPA